MTTWKTHRRITCCDCKTCKFCRFIAALGGWICEECQEAAEKRLLRGGDDASDRD